MAQRIIAGALVLCVLMLGRLSAQDSTRAVRIGLTYDAGTRPGVVLLATRGPGADSVRAILQRDLENGDRVNVIEIDASAMTEMSRASLPMWNVLSKVGAAVAVQVTLTGSGFHVAVYDVAKQTTAVVKDYSAPSIADMRGWRASLHGVADDLEESLTGTRGIARTRVAFVRAHRLFVIDSDGEQTIQIAEGQIPLSPSWSPNGSVIAYSTIIPAQIVLYDAATSRSRTLASGSGIYTSPVFTPDGTSVVYAHGVDEGVDLFTIALSGGPSRRLSVGRGSDNVSPTFSPDGRRIAFMSGRAGHPEIYTMDTDGTNVDLLTPLEFGENAYRGSPDWSPDGSTVAFRSGAGSLAQIMLINLRDRGLKQLTSDGANEDPSWAPDGRHMTFISNRSGVKQLWILDVATGRTRQLTRGQGGVNNPSWSPRLPSN